LKPEDDLIYQIDGKSVYSLWSTTITSLKLAFSTPRNTHLRRLPPPDGEYKAFCEELVRKSVEFLLDDEELEVVVRVKRAMKKMVKEDGGGGGGPPGGDGGDGGGVDEDENEDRDEDEKPDDGDGARKDRDSSRKEGNDEKGKGRGTTGGNTLGLAPTLDNSKISTKPAEVSSLFPIVHQSSVC